MFYKNDISGAEGGNSAKPVLRKRLDPSPLATCISVNDFSFCGSEVTISHSHLGREQRTPNILPSPPPTHPKAEEKRSVLSILLCTQVNRTYKNRKFVPSYIRAPNSNQDVTVLGKNLLIKYCINLYS